MIFRDSFDVRLSRHAMLRALERGITPDMIEACVQGGQINRFGRGMVRFEIAYKRFRVQCVGSICGNIITIVTVTTT